MKSPALILNETVCHLFYDRVHLEAALERIRYADYFIIDGEAYSYRDFLKTIIEKLVGNPEKYPICAYEQICIRFYLVDQDLRKRFPNHYQEAELSLITIKNLQEKVLPKESKILKTNLDFSRFNNLPNEFKFWMEEASQYFNYPYGLAHAMKKVALIPHIINIFAPVSFANYIDNARKAILFTYLSWDKKPINGIELLDESYYSANNFLIIAQDKIDFEESQMWFWALTNQRKNIIHDNSLYVIALQIINICLALSEDNEHYLKMASEIFQVSPKAIQILQKISDKISECLGWGCGEKIKDKTKFKEANKIDNYFFPEKFSEIFSMDLKEIDLDLDQKEHGIDVYRLKERTVSLNGISDAIFSCFSQEGIDIRHNTDVEINKILYRFATDKLKAFPLSLAYHPKEKNYATLRLENILNELISSVEVDQFFLPGLLIHKIFYLGNSIYQINKKIYNIDQLLGSVNYERIILTEKQIKFFSELHFYLYKKDLVSDMYQKNNDFDQDIFYTSQELPENLKNFYLSIAYNSLKQYNSSFTENQDFLRYPSKCKSDVLKLVYKIFESIIVSQILYQPVSRLMDQWHYLKGQCFCNYLI